jgi:hypothetical protein
VSTLYLSVQLPPPCPVLSCSFSGPVRVVPHAAPPPPPRRRSPLRRRVACLLLASLGSSRSLVPWPGGRCELLDLCGERSAFRFSRGSQLWSRGWTWAWPAPRCARFLAGGVVAAGAISTCHGVRVSCPAAVRSTPPSSGVFAACSRRSRGARFRWLRCFDLRRCSAHHERARFVSGVRGGGSFHVVAFPLPVLDDPQPQVRGRCS